MNEPTVEQLIAAFASVLLPFAGDTGVKLANVVPALQSLLDTFKQHPDADFTVADLISVVAANNTALAQAWADYNASLNP